MHPVLPANRDVPLFNIEQLRDIEHAALSSLPDHTLMRRAGLAVAQLALAVAPHASRVWIAAGPGNNGGDGLEAAIHLLRSGKQVHVTLLGDPARLPADAKDAYARALAAGAEIKSETDAVALLREGDVAIDALLGIGMARPAQGKIAEVIDVLNGVPCDVIAVDLPSGLNADTGQPNGSSCVRANHTLSLLALKSGLFTGAGRDHCGRVWLDDLGIDTSSRQPRAWLGGDCFNAIPARAHAQHKGSFGDVAIVGGARGMTGAAILAGRAALAAGAGRTFVNLLDGAQTDLDLVRPELMLRPDWWKSDDAILTRTTVACGCGGGDAVRATLPRVLSLAQRLVLDADALNAVAADSQLQHMLKARASRKRMSVLTPHPLEAARLLGCTTAQVQSDRYAAALDLAERFDAVVLLKGSGTLIAAQGMAVHVNPTGNAALSTAGTGDVLAGWLAGLWAQTAEGDTREGAARIARVAAWAHGNAADESQLRVLPASDLISRLAAPRRAGLSNLHQR